MRRILLAVTDFVEDAVTESSSLADPPPNIRLVLDEIVTNLAVHFPLPRLTFISDRAVAKNWPCIRRRL